MITKEQKNFILQNKEIILSILGIYLEHYKTVIWKEKDLAKKSENSAVADRLEDAMLTIKTLKISNKKTKNTFTGV
jgi:hypothetical protein